MAILVSCAGCDKQFRAKDQFRNTRLKCPSCKTDVLVRGPHVCGTDVFISHSTADKQVADAVTAAMESKNLRCWIAPRDIPAGASWGSAIIEGIEDSRAMLLVFSEHANRSDQVLREVERAIAKKKPIVPLRIDREPMRKDYEYFLASCHWLDATDGALEDHLAGLTRTVRHLLLERAETEADQQEQAPPAATTPASTVPAPSVGAPTAAQSSRRRLVLVGLLALVAVGLAAAVFFRPSGNDSNIVGGAETQPASKPSVGNLLEPEGVLDGVVSGNWKRTPQGSLSVDGPMPGRISLGTPPPGDYELRVTFTPTQGAEGVSLILTRKGQSFAFVMSGGTNHRQYGFQRRRGPVGVNDLPPLRNGETYTAAVRVREHRAGAKLNDLFVGGVINHAELTVPPPWAIGRNTLGIVTYRDLVVHSAECIPIDTDADDTEFGAK